MKRLLVIAALLALSSLQGAASSAGATAWSPITLKIEQTWLRRSADGVQRITGNSLGTAVGPNLILTHGHFHVPPQSPRSIAFKVIDSVGQVFQYRSDEVQQIILSRETTFIYLPSAMTGSSAPLADRDTLDRLQPGAWVTVNYWDDVQQRGRSVAFRSFKCSRMSRRWPILGR
jgi:hypothetical protein